MNIRNSPQVVFSSSRNTRSEICKMLNSPLACRKAVYKRMCNIPIKTIIKHLENGAAVYTASKDVFDKIRSKDSEL